MEENWLNPEYVHYYNDQYKTSSAEFRSYLDILNVDENDSLVDFGCGCGDFLLVASTVTSRVLGIDVSEVQTALASKKLARVPNAEVVCSELTDFQPGKRRFTKGFSRKVLHHLTDQEKHDFLQNVAPAFCSGGVFYIEDGIFFDFERADMTKNWSKLLAEAASYYGDKWDEKKHDIMHSFRDEFPTGIQYWTKCFNDAGFEVVQTMPKCSFYGGLYAVKRG